MNEAGNEYPVYLVHDLDSGKEAELSGPFKEADPEFRAKLVSLKPAEHRIGFRAWTKGADFALELRYASVSPDADAGIALFFDRGHSRRQRHHMLSFRIGPDGSLSYEEFRYEIERLDVPSDIRYIWERTEDGCCAKLIIPLRHLRIELPERRMIGFNVVRILKQAGNAVVLAWSGIPGEYPELGFGTGDLLLTRGLSSAEVGEWESRAAAGSRLYFTKWEKRDVPREIYDFMAEKRSGFTVRLSRDDADRARDKADNTPWGRRIKAEMIQIADYWASQSDDELFALVPTGNPRALTVGQYFGDPLTGGNRSAFQVCLEKPYQYYNPATKTWWRNGMTIRNPSTSEEIEVQDDGRGFLAPEGFPNPGVRYMFTASYRLFLLSMLMGNPYCPVLEDREVCPETSGRRYAGAINNLAYAYVLTGNRTYARKALVLIGRIAELVPYMNGNYASGYYDTVQIAEPSTTETHWLSNLFEAADLLYDSMEELDPTLRNFFAGKPDAENKPRTKPFCVRTAIHEMIPYILYSAEIEKTREADWSLRWIYLELIVASYMGSGKLMNRILFEGKFSLASKLSNSFFRDGRYVYDSFHYIGLICEQTAMMANNNYRFRDEAYFPAGIDLFDNAELGLHEVIRLFARLKAGGLTPMFGDTPAGNAEPILDDHRKGKSDYTPAYEILYRRAPSMRTVFGELLSRYEEDELENLRVRCVRQTKDQHALLLLASAAEWPEYRQYRSDGENIPDSFLLQDSQTSVFRAGTDPRNCKHVVLYGQPTAGHRHGDKLGLWIGGYGYHLLASAGGYPYTWLSPKFEAWEKHAAACTVVVVDGKDQSPSYSRQLGHYEGDLLQMAGLENAEANPGTIAERWCLVVQAPGKEDAYIADLNFMTNGTTFDYNTIGLGSSFEQIRFEGIKEDDWIPMCGTLAGPDVPLYSKPGYGWMKAVRKASPATPVAWTFPYGGASLKVHAVPNGRRREVICCLGEKGGEETGKSRWEPFVMWRDESKEGQPDRTAGFVAVLEPYARSPFIRRVIPMAPPPGSAPPGFVRWGWKSSIRTTDIGISCCVRTPPGHPSTIAIPPEISMKPMRRRFFSDTGKIGSFMRKRYGAPSFPLEVLDAHPPGRLTEEPLWLSISRAEASRCGSSTRTPDWPRRGRGRRR